MKIDFEDLPDMETFCNDCYGKGFLKKRPDAFNNQGYQLRCFTCKGSGKILSEFGQALFSLMKNYEPWQDSIDNLRLMIKND